MTIAQIFAILAVLSSFGVDQSVVDNIRNILIPPAVAVQQPSVVPSSPRDTITPMSTEQPQAVPAPAAQAPTPPANVPFKITGIANGASAPANAPYVAALTITNGTNDKLTFDGIGNITSLFQVSEKSEGLENWNPVFDAYYRSAPIANDLRGILPGETVEVRFRLAENAPVAGTFKLSIQNVKLTGSKSGASVALSGFPIDLGTINVQ